MRRGVPKGVLPKSYYGTPDVVGLARDLLGKRLCTHLNGQLTSGLITETEAYNGAVDRACHAFGGRRTRRTETMFGTGGSAYVYLCYGIHHLFNVVVSQTDDPKAVLIRGVKIDQGLEVARQRRGEKVALSKLSAGPGTLSQALGITTALDNTSLLGQSIWIERTGMDIPDQDVAVGPRIGVEYAGEDALLPYRFVWTPS